MNLLQKNREDYLKQNYEQGYYDSSKKDFLKDDSGNIIKISDINDATLLSDSNIKKAYNIPKDDWSC